MTDIIQQPKVVKIGIACSGGVDSMVLLHQASQIWAESNWRSDQQIAEILKTNSASEMKPQVQFFTIHLDHQLRQTSPEDQQFVCEQSKDLGFPFYTQKASDFPEYPRLGSLETWARELRYAFYQRAAKELELDEIWMAHHQDDQVETLWMRLERGTGLRGLRGIPQRRKLDLKPANVASSATAAPAQSIELYRPLLKTTRNAIVEYAQANNIGWREDESNRDIEYRRNYWRHQGRELLNSKMDQADESLLKISQTIESFWHILEHDLNSFGSTPSELENLDWALILEQESAWIALFIAEKFPNHPGFAQQWTQGLVREIRKWWKSGYKVSFPLTNGWVLERSTDAELQKVLRLRKFQPKMVEFHEKCAIGTSVTAVLGAKMYFLETQIITSSLTEEFDSCAFCTFMELELNGEPIVLRTRQPGDLFSPSPNKFAARTLKKFLNEVKVPSSQRNQLPLVAQGNRVLWVPGWGVSGLHQVATSLTSKVKLKLICQK